MASSGSKSSKIEDRGFLKALWRIVVASGRSNSSTLKILDLLSLYGGQSLPPAGRNPQKHEGVGF